MRSRFCVFSYNRGPLLRNCVESAFACHSNIELTIFDDGSDDAETLEVLHELERRCEVMYVDNSLRERHGGLYRNMQSALIHASDVDLAIFLQDDMQFVRHFESNDLMDFYEYSAANNTARLVYPAFLKKRTVDILNIGRDADGNYTAAPALETVGVFYSDVFAARPRDLLSKNWSFAESEIENERRGAEIFEKMVYTPSPILAYLPRPPSYRGKRRDLGIKVVEKIYKFGLHPISILEHQALERGRSVRTMPPVCEDVLECKSLPSQSEWMFSVFDVGDWVYALSRLARNPISYVALQLKRRVFRRS